jgi:FAD/FMN-containing dehydrogenase
MITMNMPSNQGNLVHQIFLEHPAASCEEFCRILNEDIFVSGRQFYRRQSPAGENFWQDRGEIVLNTAHIGKVQQYVDYEKENDDETYGHSGQRSFHVETTRGPLRPRRGSF